MKWRQRHQVLPGRRSAPEARSILMVVEIFYILEASGFMFYFTPLLRVLFTFPSRYFFAIGHSGVFSLTKWSSWIRTRFHVSHSTRGSDVTCGFLLDLHHLWCREIHGKIPRKRLQKLFLHDSGPSPNHDHVLGISLSAPQLFFNKVINTF